MPTCKFSSEEDKQCNMCKPLLRDQDVSVQECYRSSDCFFKDNYKRLEGLRKIIKVGDTVWSIKSIAKRQRVVVEDSFFNSDGKAWYLDDGGGFVNVTAWI